MEVVGRQLPYVAAVRTAPIGLGEASHWVSATFQIACSPNNRIWGRKTWPYLKFSKSRSKKNIFLSRKIFKKRFSQNENRTCPECLYSSSGLRNRPRVSIGHPVRPDGLHSHTPPNLKEQEAEIWRRKSRTSKNAKSRKWDFRTWKNEVGDSKMILFDLLRKNENFLKFSRFFEIPWDILHFSRILLLVWRVQYREYRFLTVSIVFKISDAKSPKSAISKKSPWHAHAARKCSQQVEALTDQSVTAVRSSFAMCGCSALGDQTSRIQKVKPLPWWVKSLGPLPFMLQRGGGPKLFTHHGSSIWVGYKELR